MLNSTVLKPLGINICELLITQTNKLIQCETMKSIKKFSTLNSLKTQFTFFPKTFSFNREALTIFLLLFCGQPTLAADSYPAADGPIIITPLVHSSVQLEYEGLIIQVDPWSISGLSSAKKADLIVTECSLIEYNFNGPLIRDQINHFFDQLGFSLFDIVDLLYGKKGELLQIDALFKNKNFEFEQD